MRVRAALRMALLLPLAACAGLDQIDYGRVLTSGRDGWQYPERVVASLGIAPGDVVADIGAGDGYFVRWFSEAVGPEGTVYAVEVDDEHVRKIEARVAKEGLRNVKVILGKFEDPGLPDGTIDLAFTCNTYHHIEDRPAYFERLRADLTPKGRIAHVDERDDVGGILRLFQTAGHWTPIEVMRREMAQAGYHRTAGYNFLPTQSFEVFAPNDE